MVEISVIMSVYKGNPIFLRQAIESVLNQTFTDFEFFIVLDCPESTENKAIMTEYAQKDERIKLIFNEKNIGLAASLNKAIAEAKGKYLARLDEDDISKPNRFLMQKEYLENGNFDIIGGYVETINEENKIISPVIKVPTTTKQVYKTLKINSCIFHSTWFLKRDVFNALGGYTYAYIEDYELLLKAAKNGYKMGNVPEIILSYRMSSGSYSRSNLFWQYLCMRYMQLSYFSKKKLPENIDDFIKMHFSEKKSLKYARSADCLTQSLELLHNKKFFKAIPKLFVAFFGSRYYFEKIFRYAIQYIM